MVNAGSPSRGCLTCRHRRVKCDETLPTCTRCIKSKRHCLGYSSPDRSSDQSVTLRGNTVSRHSNSTYRSPPLGLLGNFSAPPKWLRPALHDFLNTFVVNSKAVEGSRGYLDSLYDSIVEYHSDPTFYVVVNVISHCYKSLSEPMQTIQMRRSSHNGYGMLIHQIIVALSADSHPGIMFTCVYLLALYEMTINTSSEDRAWQTHLNGLLAIMCGHDSQSSTASQNGMSILAKAMTTIEDRIPITEQSSPGNSHIPDLENALSILLVAILRMRALSPLLDSSFKIDTSRKLDVQKLRKAVKQIYRDFCVFESVIPENARPLSMSATALSTASQPKSTIPSTISTSSDCTELYPDAFVATLWNTYRTMLILNGGFLIRSGQFLSARKDCTLTKELTTLSEKVRHAANSIYAYVNYYTTTSYAPYPNSHRDSSGVTTD